MSALSIEQIKDAFKKHIFPYDGFLEDDQDWKVAYRNFMDSLDFIDIVMKCEKQFKVTITDREAAEVRSMQDLVNLIFIKLNPQQNAHV